MSPVSLAHSKTFSVNVKYYIVAYPSFRHIKVIEEDFKDHTFHGLASNFILFPPAHACLRNKNQDLGEIIGIDILHID